MLDFLICNIYDVFGDPIFQQTVGIPMGTNCAQLLADLFLNSYEAEFFQKLVREKNKTLAVAFNSTLDILMTFCLLTMVIFILTSILYIPVSWK